MEVAHKLTSCAQPDINEYIRRPLLQQYEEISYFWESPCIWLFSQYDVGICTHIYCMLVTGSRHRCWLDIGLHAEPDQHDSFWTDQSGDRGATQPMGSSDFLHRICPLPQSAYYSHPVCPWSKPLSCVYTWIFISYISDNRYEDQKATLITTVWDMIWDETSQTRK